MHRQNLLGLLHELSIETHVLRAAQGSGAVIVTPGLVGRVLALDLAEDEPLHVYLNAAQLRAGFSTDGRNGWNNFGGAERIWFGPEGGRFGLMFDDERQTYDRYRFQPAHHQTSFKTIQAQPDRVLCAATAELCNAEGTRFSIAIEREIRALPDCPLLLGQDGIPQCGFETRTRIMNRGSQAWDWERGLLSLWTLGQFYCRPSTVIMVPLRRGPESELGPPVRSDYFAHLCPNGVMPDEAWRLAEDLVLLNGAARVQTKIDIGPRRALGRLGALELETGLLTIVDFDLRPELPYLAPYWLPHAGDPRDGSAISIFSLGGGAEEPFFELESYSPGLPLAPGASYTHVSRTWLARLTPAAQDDVLRRWFATERTCLLDFSGVFSR